jgi:hypothetical protein
MSTAYAARTGVAPDRSLAELERELTKRGATAFGYNWTATETVVAFTLSGLQVRMALPMPNRADHQDYKARNGARVSGQKTYDLEVRRRWRALVLVVKAKLIAVDEGITSLEREFLADTILVDGTTVLEHVRPAIEQTRRQLEAVQ